MKAVRGGEATTFTSQIAAASLRHNYGLDFGHLGRENFKVEQFGVALPKRSPLLGPFNWA